MWSPCNIQDTDKILKILVKFEVEPNKDIKIIYNVQNLKAGSKDVATYR